MAKRPVIIVGALLGIIVFGAVVWWLVSPLFIDNTIDEAFPFAAPNAAEVAAMSEEDRLAMEAEFAAAVPDQTDLAQLSPEDQAKVEERVQEAAAVVMTDKSMEEPMPTTAAAEWLVVKQGNFVDADDFHKGTGAATIYQQGEELVLRFEDFDVTNGPDLHVVLSQNAAPSSSSEVGDYLDLGSLHGNQGNQNYPVPAGTDLSSYQSVVIYCVPFHVVFATASLN